MAQRAKRERRVFELMSKRRFLFIKKFKKTQRGVANLIF